MRTALDRAVVGGRSLDQKAAIWLDDHAGNHRDGGPIVHGLQRSRILRRTGTAAALVVVGPLDLKYCHLPVGMAVYRGRQKPKSLRPVVILSIKTFGGESATAQWASQTRSPRMTKGWCLSGPTPPSRIVLTVAGAAPEVEAVTPLGVCFVILEADERKRADIDRAPLVRRPRAPATPVEARRRGDLVAEAVLVALDGDVAHERVAAVGPPEARPFVAIERESLAGQRRPCARLHGQVAVQDVVDLGAVFEEKTVADRAGNRRNRGRPVDWCRGS